MIDVEIFDYPIDPMAVTLGGQVCQTFNVTIPCEFRNEFLIDKFNL
jgi:hypothetical protein